MQYPVTIEDGKFELFGKTFRPELEYPAYQSQLDGKSVMVEMASAGTEHVMAECLIRGFTPDEQFSKMDMFWTEVYAWWREV